jgi:hypothetical protein
MTRTALLVALLAVLASPAVAAPKAGETLACLSKDPAKRLYVVVGAVEPFGAGGTVANVTLIDETPGARVPTVAHLPIDAKVLEASCPRPADRPRALAAKFEAGRRQWLDAVRTQNAGVFSITIDQVDDVIRQQVAELSQ